MPFVAQTTGLKVTVYLEGCLASKRCSASSFSNSGRKAARVKFSVLFLISVEGAELGNRGRRVEGPELPHVFSLLSLPHSLRVCE